MKIRVDATKCSGIGLCEMTAPTVFEIGDDGQSHVIGDADEDRAVAQEAVSNCPTGAISIDN
ncbi:ferredoxin reductase [Mycobacterium sp. 852013-50091_SCH5140682]|uniref:ferredoxin n=1 Tax=Mycobacterium sp. 852013-50091_SCH5140682 TaxID=1834109 RepID=UPI0007E9E7DF|nr:ferredoxin [Mycobacterium sp. 852013-50091_SCH5140682]OBC11965.1 ferredoxin reductase [Mycobacterium sp. 852013-50091_SCH5140682]